MVIKLSMTMTARLSAHPYPDFTWGITNNFTYKAFDLSFMVQGSQGGQLVNGDPNYNETKRYNKTTIKPLAEPDVSRGWQNALFYSWLQLDAYGLCGRRCFLLWLA